MGIKQKGWKGNPQEFGEPKDKEKQKKLRQKWNTVSPWQFLWINFVIKSCWRKNKCSFFLKWLGWNSNDIFLFILISTFYSDFNAFFFVHRQTLSQHIQISTFFWHWQHWKKTLPMICIQNRQQVWVVLGGGKKREGGREEKRRRKRVVPQVLQSSVGLYLKSSPSPSSII